MNNDKNIGLIKILAKEIIPDKFLECDGSELSREIYWELFSIIGTTFGEGDGNLTFNIPDFRGEFIRGWDNGAGIDPDAGSRTAINNGNSGDNIGSIQDFMMQKHKHIDSGHTHLYYRYAALDGSGTNPLRDLSVIWYNTNGVSTSTNSASFGDPSNSGTGAGTPKHSNEIRPKNISARFCVKFQ